MHLRNNDQRSNDQRQMHKITLLGLTLLFAHVTWAQDTAVPAFTLNHLAISVEDVDVSAKFYQDIFNFQEITNRSALDGVRWFSLGEGKELHLISIIDEEITLNKAIHLAFTTPEFNAFVKTIEAHNMDYSDWPGTPDKINIRADGIRQIFFQDPDGYWIEVNSAGRD